MVVRLNHSFWMPSNFSIHRAVHLFHYPVRSTSVHASAEVASSGRMYRIICDKSSTATIATAVSVRK